MKWMRSLACAALLATSPVPASAEKARLEYEGLAYGFIPFGKASIDFEVGPDYEAHATIRSAGLGALFAHAEIDAHATGALAADVRPTLYRLDHLYNGLHRRSSVRWAGETVSVAATPNYPYPGDPAPTPAQRAEGRDPLSTILAMGVQVAASGRCDGLFRVFDGRYIYDVTLRDAGPGALKLNGTTVRVAKCVVRQKRVAGYKKPEDLKKTLPDGELWFALGGGPVALPIRLSSKLPFGAATIRVTSATIEP